MLWCIFCSTMFFLLLTSVTYYLVYVTADMNFVSKVNVKMLKIFLYIWLTLQTLIDTSGLYLGHWYATAYGLKITTRIGSMALESKVKVCVKISNYAVFNVSVDIRDAPPPSISCADLGLLSERGPNLITFSPFQLMRGSKYHHKLAIIGPPAKRHLNGVLLAGLRWPNIASNVIV